MENSIHFYPDENLVLHELKSFDFNSKRTDSEITELANKLLSLSDNDLKHNICYLIDNIMLYNDENNCDNISELIKKDERLISFLDILLEDTEK